MDTSLSTYKRSFTEDGKDLIEAAKKYGSFVGILVDFDAYGRSIAEGVKTRTPIIGIDKKTITWLQQNGYKITIADVEEEYKPKIWTQDPYLQHHRIELDSVAQKVEAEGFWKYVMYRVNLLVKRLDYTNVIIRPISETLYPIEITDFLSDLQEYTSDITETKWEEIETELTNVTELIDIKVKGDEIHERLSPTVGEDQKMRLIAKELEKLSELLES